MKEKGLSTGEATAVWDDHVFQAAKAFLKCAVAIDDRPFGGGRPASGGSARLSDERASLEVGSASTMGSPIPRVRTAVRNAGLARSAGVSDARGPRTAASATEGRMDADAGSAESNSLAQDLDLRALTDAFAEQGIVCGTLIPDKLQVENDTAGYGETVLIERACKMARTADILIIDWFLKERNCETTLKIIKEVLGADKREGGRTRLICVYTGEDQLVQICEQVAERVSEERGCESKTTGDTIRLTNQKSSIVFFNKKRVESPYAAAEGALAARLIKEFALLIDGLLPSFAASAIGAVRRNTHGVLSIFQPALDSAYVGNRAISDPSDEVAQLVRELLVSEFDNQIGFSKSVDKYLSAKAISGWLEAPGRVRDNCTMILAEQLKGGKSKAVKRKIDTELIQRAACGDIVTLEKFTIDGVEYKINEKQRLKFTQALCTSAEAANEIEQDFARLVSNQREAYGRETIEKDWRPSLTLGTVLVTDGAGRREFYMCITRACDMVRLERSTKRVILLHLEEREGKFNLVIPDTRKTVVKLFVPREFGSMRSVEFKVEGDTQRITGTEQSDEDGKYFRFDARSGDVEYRYLGELRYLRALRDVSEITKNSTAIGIADSEWLRLSERR